MASQTATLGLVLVGSIGSVPPQAFVPLRIELSANNNRPTMLFTNGVCGEAGGCSRCCLGSGPAVWQLRPWVLSTTSGDLVATMVNECAWPPVLHPPHPSRPPIGRQGSYGPGPRCRAEATRCARTLFAAIATQAPPIHGSQVCLAKPRPVKRNLWTNRHHPSGAPNNAPPELWASNQTRCMATPPDMPAIPSPPPPSDGATQGGHKPLLPMRALLACVSSRTTRLRAPEVPSRRTTPPSEARRGRPNTYASVGAPGTTAAEYI